MKMTWQRSTSSKAKRSFLKFGVSWKSLMTKRSNGRKTGLNLSPSSRGKTKACTITTRPFSSWRSSLMMPVFTWLGKISGRFLPEGDTVSWKRSYFFFYRYFKNDGRCSNYYVRVYVVKSERDKVLLYGDISSSNTNVLVWCPIQSICKDFKGTFSWKKVQSADNSSTARFLVAGLNPTSDLLSKCLLQNVLWERNFKGIERIYACRISSLWKATVKTSSRLRGPKKRTRGCTRVYAPGRTTTGRTGLQAPGGSK